MSRRLLAPAVGLVVLVALSLWLLRPDVTLVDLGPADALVGRPGVARVLARDGQGRWRALALAGRDAHASRDGLLLDGVRGLPALTSDGRVLALLADGLVEVAADADRPRRGPALPAGSSPDAVELLGASSDDRPVLRVSGADGARLAVLTDAGFTILADAAGDARPESDGYVALCGRGRTAVAFRAPDGWEAWTWDAATGEARRALARDCRRERALFHPSGDSLVVDGKAAGLFSLDLDSDRLSFMGDGNLGYDARVPWTVGFRGDPLMLVHPEFDLHGFSQVYQTHFTGGGRFQFTTGHVHHYLSTMSPDGRFLTYAQSSFEAEASGFAEDLYLFDFDRGSSAALSLGERVGGLPDQGPLWAGDDPTPVLLWVAGGRAWCVERSVDPVLSPES